MNISACCHQELPLEEDIEGKMIPSETCPKCGSFCTVKFVTCFGEHDPGKEYCQKVCRFAEACFLLKKSRHETPRPSSS